MDRIVNFIKEKIKLLSFITILLLIIFVNVVRVNADFMDGDRVDNRKERQLIDKIDAIKEAFPNQIDKEALYATLAHRGTLTDYINESYDENFNIDSYSDDLDNFSEQIATLGNNIIQNVQSIGQALLAQIKCWISGNKDENGHYDENCVIDEMINMYIESQSNNTTSSFVDVQTIKTPQSIDLLMAATIVMLDSSGWTGNYSDENYQKALAGDQLVGNMFDKYQPIQNAQSIIMNGVFCAVGTTFNMLVDWFNPGITFDNGRFGVEAVDIAGRYRRYYTMSTICNNGFIGGTYSQVKNPNLETEEGKEQYQKKKDVIAKEIIELAKFYRGESDELGDICITGNTQAGDLSDMTPALCAQRFGAMAQADYSRTGVLASITLAQAWLESNCGKYTPPNSNNIFGIKCNGNWQGECSYANTSEEVSSGHITINAGFRVYSSVEESIYDHSKFLIENERYTRYGFFNATDYVGQAWALQNATYATDSNYASTLISIIETNNFDKWDVKVNTTSSLDNCAPVGNSGWTIRTVAPTKSDQAFVQSTNAANNTGQCVWYARGRALEIVEELRSKGKMSDDEASKISNLLMRAYGNGGDIYDNAKSVFNGSSDIRKPKAGSYIVWKKPGSWGHVGIVEDVTDTTITLTEGWSTGGGSLSCNSDWSCVTFDGPNTYELEDFYNNYGAHRDGSYVFSGYVYFLEPLN